MIGEFLLSHENVIDNTNKINNLQLAQIRPNEVLKMRIESSNFQSY